MTEFTHLHVHTQYSLLDGAAKINELVSKAKELGMSAIAITDHGVLYGIVDFYKACKKVGIKPIIGFEAYITDKNMTDKTGGVGDHGHIILLAKNDIGLKNIIKLDSKAFTDGFYYKPRIDYALLEQYSEGIVCLSGCLAGHIPSYLLSGQRDRAVALANRLKGIFGDDYYIEIQNHGIPEQKMVLPMLIELANELNIELVATNDIHYVNKEDAKYQDALLCIQTDTKIDDENRMRMSADEFYIKSGDDMAAIFKSVPKAISNTMVIADKCNAEIDLSHSHMPRFIAPDGMDNYDYLKKLCDEGLKDRGMKGDKTAEDRIEYEISVISSMGFVDYFLIVHDFIAFARRNGIFIGPGRGSGVGSLVAYCLRITDVNPLKYNLLFERLLNPERVSMPDIDIDMCIERRQEVIDYVADKYGHDHVCQIATFGTLKAKQAIKDVGRVMRMTPAYTDKLCSLILNEQINMPLAKIVDENKELRAFMETDPDAARIIEYATHLEGLQRHVSTHAAGVVIAPEPLTELVPIHVTKGVISTQYTKDTVEEVGLLKMDFLGLRTLTVIRYALEMIEHNGKKVPDLDHMEYDDENVYKMISAGETDGVFQLESSGMRQFMTQLKPECFEDIIAGISLYRPGPMDRIPDYIRGKHNKDTIHYDDERLKPILEPTYGVMVYQEQVMQMVRTLAGYSMGRSDLIRRAMAKKKHDVMEQERKNFINGIVDENGNVTVPGTTRNGIDPSVANKIFNEMMDFASYAFNKSHAAAYAVVAYKTAYLKYYYPLEFMTAMINSFIGTSDQVAEYVYYCQSHGIKVLPPDINESGVKFTPEGECARAGFAAVKGVGESAAESIVDERNKNGKFKDFHDFAKRVGGIGKRVVESLIKAGAFLSLGYNRAQLLECYDEVLDVAASERDKRSGGQMLLFDLFGDNDDSGVTVEIKPRKEYDEAVISQMERESLGMYLTHHPLNDYAELLRNCPVTISGISGASEETTVTHNERVVIPCIIDSVSKKKTKSGNIMASGSIEDLTGRVEFLAFPQVLTKYASLLYEQAIVVIDGKASIEDERSNAVIVDTIKSLDDYIDENAKLYLRFDDENKELSDAVMEVLKKYGGRTKVYFHNPSLKRTRQTPQSYFVNLTDGGVIEELNKLLGEDNVKMAVNWSSGAGYHR